MHYENFYCNAWLSCVHVWLLSISAAEVEQGMSCICLILYNLKCSEHYLHIMSPLPNIKKWKLAWLEIHLLNTTNKLLTGSLETCTWCQWICHVIAVLVHKIIIEQVNLQQNMYMYNMFLAIFQPILNCFWWFRDQKSSKYGFEYGLTHDGMKDQLQPV